MKILEDDAGRSLGKMEGERTTKKLWIVCGVFLASSTFVLIFNCAQQSTTLSARHYLHRDLPAQIHHPSHSRSPQPDSWYNLLVEESSNYTSTLMKYIQLNSTGADACYDATTNTTELEGLPNPVDGRFLFRTDMVHHLTLISYDTNGKRRCAGGDYYEVDLHDRRNVHYRSRLPTVDFGNGSYGLELMVPSRFAESFSLDIWLLFSNWHGMDHKTEAWVRQTLMLSQEFEMIGHQVDESSVNSTKLKIENPDSQNLRQCTQADFARNTWQGRWTRSWFNDACQADDQKRFRCLPEEHYQCEEPWCFGPVGRLESNGWHYSAHCSFKIFEQEEAWKCLDGRWFLIWGDSNFQDTIRNMLLFILDWKLPPSRTLADFQLERTYESGFVNPHKYDQVFQVSQHFNGAHPPWIYGAGLNTLQYEVHRQTLLSHFNGTRWPDTIIMNSGLHDGDQFDTIEEYAASADFAIEWWMQLYNSIEEDRRPQLIWRSTIAPAGVSRKMNANPNKMEMFNQVIVEKFQQVRDKLPVKFIDGLDLTFPFHYNNDYSDGGHYGRAPGANLRPWHKKPHWYFVDVMLGHIFLNVACPATE